MFSICACSNINVTKIHFDFLKKGFKFTVLLAALNSAYKRCGQTVGWAFVQQNCFPPAERALVLEIACYNLRMFTPVVSTPQRCLLYFLMPRTPLMYYLFFVWCIKSGLNILSVSTVVVKLTRWHFKFDFSETNDSWLAKNKNDRHRSFYTFYLLLQCLIIQKASIGLSEKSFLFNTWIRNGVTQRCVTTHKYFESEGLQKKKKIKKNLSASDLTFPLKQPYPLNTVSQNRCIYRAKIFTLSSPLSKKPFLFNQLT